MEVKNRKWESFLLLFLRVHPKTKNSDVSSTQHPTEEQKP